ncbi:MAG: response regulator [Bacteroidota bacterium]
MDNETVNILLVEDSAGDAELTREALANGRISHHLDVVCDGEEAIQFLNKKGKYSNANKPDLILLDLNMPRKDGFEVLSEIKDNPNLNTIPVVILTTSNSEQDFYRCFELKASAFFIKPVDLYSFFEVINSIEDFWFTKAKSPTLPK